MSVFIEKNYDLHPVPSGESYGLEFPEGTSQLTIELKCFNWASVGLKKGKIQSRYYHGLNIVRLLWGEQVHISKEYTNPENGETFIIYNNYFLDTFRFLCENKRAALTGSASSGKTFTTSVYALVCYYSSPINTTIMVSTTTGTSSERRVWGDIKELHKSAYWKENGFINAEGRAAPIGHIIEYLKCLTLEQEDNLKSRKNATQRDLGNGLMVVPIAQGQEGKNALSSIIGTKNDFVIWIIDELPEMMEGVLRPRTNLGSNPRFQLIGIGNANLHTDPHGDFCRPKNGGYETYTLSYVESSNIETWEAKGCNVLFLHGERSPNYHPGVFQSTEPLDYPFPKLSNYSYNIQIAIDSDPDGNPEEGKKTVDYNRFGIGFWVTSGISNTILSIEQIKRYKCQELLDTWSYTGRRKYASCDASFTEGGDECIAAIAEIGSSVHNKEQCKIVTHKINPNTDNIDKHGGFKNACAAQYAELLIKEGVEPSNACIEAMQDGGQFLMYAVQCLAKEHGVAANSLHAIQSLGNSSHPERYDNLVTEYWYDVPLFVSLGIWKEFEISSKYCSDFCSRQYFNVGKGRVAVEKKKDMKKRIGRSPDCFVAGTMVDTDKGKVAIENIQAGDMIMTPFGFSRCLQTVESQSTEIYEAEFGNNYRLVGKGNHTIFTFNRGWVKLKDLKLTDAVDYAILRPIWIFLRTLFTEAEPTGFKPAVDIIKIKTEAARRRDFFIESSGLGITEVFLMGMLSITKMAIGKIMKLATLSLRRIASIFLTTLRKGGKTTNTEKMDSCILRLCETGQHCGTNLKKAENGIPFMLRNSTLKGNTRTMNALSAVLYFNHGARGVPNIVPLIAIKSSIGKSVRRLGSAVFAIARFALINMAKRNSALVVVRRVTTGKSEKVYNLTLAEDNAYYANGILVSNCADAIAYLIFMLKIRGEVNLYKNRSVQTEEPPPSFREMDIDDYDFEGSEEEEGDFVSIGNGEASFF